MIPTNAYRVRVQMRTNPGHCWFKGFDTAGEAAEYLYKAMFKMGGEYKAQATRPAANGSRQWVTLQGLRNIARRELSK